MQAGARCFASCEGTGDGLEALLPLKTSNAEAKSAVEKGRWVGLGFVHMGGGARGRQVEDLSMMCCVVLRGALHVGCRLAFRAAEGVEGSWVSLKQLG